MRRMLRSGLIRLSQNQSVERLARKYGPNLGASRFVAGETILDALRVVRTLNERGFTVTLDHLGEFTASRDAAREATAECVRALEMIQLARVSSQLSVKLTQLGLDIDPALCEENMRFILDVAKATDNFVCMDMEDYAHCERTLDLFKRLRNDYPCIGTVLQAYLRRTSHDLDQLAPFAPALRIVKGAYQESADVAFPKKSDVDDNYERLVVHQLQSFGFTAIATHDEHLIARIGAFIQDRRILPTHYEFQMLYGIRPQLQEQLVERGFSVRIYVPYGTDWYGYFMRRIAERPANAGFVLRNLLRH